MNFMTIGFLVFLVILLIVMHFCKKLLPQNIILLVASYVFYALGDWRFLLMLAAISVLMWLFGRIIAGNRGTKRARLALIGGIALDLAVLGLFKYFNFFAESFGKLFGTSFTTLKLVLPIGLSFYIFQAISYLADVYLGRTKAERFPLRVMLYIGFFPQIVSGPIVKAKDFLPQLDRAHAITRENLSWGSQRFLLGLFKKAVIADRLGVAVDAVYAAPAAYDSLSLLLAVVAYTIQIYCDFSGYSDMAVGVAKMLGFDLGRNFNLPLLATNPSDFWKRWHISLSSWFRDYVYIPLGGNRKGKLRTYLNLFITMLLSGLWHGANWTFIVWGACHALISVIHKLFSDIRKKTGLQTHGALNRVLKVISAFAMLSCTILFFVPFRSADLTQAGLILTRLFTGCDGIRFVSVYVLIFIALFFIINIASALFSGGEDPWKPLDLSKWRGKFIFLLFLLITLCFAYIGNTAFIYAQF